MWESWRGGQAPAVACDGCAWHYTGGRGRPVARCHRFRGTRIRADWPACPAFLAESDLRCETCGACCREAFHVVELGPRDPFRKHRPDLIVQEDGRYTLPRAADGRCPCLTPKGHPEGDRCTEYAHRPRTCRDFTLGSANCVEARRRVGLSV